MRQISSSLPSGPDPKPFLKLVKAAMAAGIEERELTPIITRHLRKNHGMTAIQARTWWSSHLIHHMPAE